MLTDLYFLSLPLYSPFSSVYSFFRWHIRCLLNPSKRTVLGIGIRFLLIQDVDRKRLLLVGSGRTISFTLGILTPDKGFGLVKRNSVCM